MVFCCSSESVSDSVDLESPGKHGMPYWAVAGTPCQGTHSQPFGTVCDSPGLRACGTTQQSQCAVCTSPVVPPQRDPRVQPPLWANIATSGRDITSSCPKRGTDSSSPATPCPHCSLAVPRLLLPHGTNGSGSVRGRLCFCSANFQNFCM